ncbi:hypothetical protein ACQRCP_06770, partial [Streptococcus alactolyticus]
EYQHDESLLLNYKFLASNLTSIPIIQNFKIMHYQTTQNKKDTREVSRIFYSAIAPFNGTKRFEFLL